MKDRPFAGWDRIRDFPDSWPLSPLREVQERRTPQVSDAGQDQGGSRRAGATWKEELLEVKDN
jgi:hypothetical protein